MDKREKRALANQAYMNSIEQFATAMRTAYVDYIAETGRKTPSMETAWGVYVEACKWLVELSN